MSRKPWNTGQVPAVAAALLLVAALASPLAERALRATAVLLQLQGLPIPAPLSLALGPITQRDLRAAGLDRTLRARSYVPVDTTRAPGLVLLHGVHPRGIDEPRLRAFARALSAAGNHVLTPELPELLAHRIEERTVPEISAIARDHAERVGHRRVGVIGISFAGGLALLAAAREQPAAAIGFVAAVGAHADLRRLCRYYARQTVHGPRGAPAPVEPHPYGARVMIRAHLARFFEPEDLPHAARVLDTYLADRHEDARRLARELSPLAQRTMAPLLDHAREHELGEMLLRASRAADRELDAASPHGKLGSLRVPVFLIHGADDPVIPSLESEWLAREIPARWLSALLVTPLLRHAELRERPTLREQAAAVSFVAGILSAADGTARDATGHR